MLTIACLLALQAVGGPVLPPDWTHDYDSALRRAKAANKPVAVFIGAGNDGWKAVCAEGDFGPEVRRLLAEHYICLYVDARRTAERELIRSFEANQSPLVVLSTRDRAYQAYRHSGSLGNASLAQALRRHATEQTISPPVPAPSVIYYEAPCRT